MPESVASIYPFPFSIGQGHDVNFSLVAGSRIYSYEEAKISQIMHDSCSRFPERSMFLGFRQLGLTPRDVAHWVWGVPHRVDVTAALSFFFKMVKCEPYEELSRQGRIHFVPHHKAHAYLAITTSPFDDGCFLTLDGGGDEANHADSTWGVFEGGRIISLEPSKGEYGLTLFHGYMCELVGYLNFTDHGKLMGLASYAEPPAELYAELWRFLVSEHDGMNFKVTVRRRSMSPLSAARVRVDAYNRYKTINQPNPPQELIDLTKFYPSHQIAAAGQRVFEDCLRGVVSRLVERTGKKNVVLCGGAFHNVSANRRLNELGIAKVFVPMGVGDEGLSLGAAFAFLAERGIASANGKPYGFLTPFLGPQFTNEEVEKLLDEYRLAHRIFRDDGELGRFVAQILANGNIVGWFQGRAELGPRALGARSVLADPRDVRSKARLNQMLKRRDWFMPFAPAILEGYESDYLEHYTHSPYMTMAFRATEKAMREIPAGIHADQTCRPNCVSRSTNPKFYRLIEEFRLLTGIPAVLNTSFNRHGIPTVASPRQAFEHLMAGAVDVLAIEDYVIWPAPDKDFPTSSLRDEKLFLAVEVIKPVVRAWVQGGGVERALDRCHPVVVERLSLRAAEDEFSVLGRVFRRRPGIEERELLTACRDLLESNASILNSLPLGRTPHSECASGG